MEIFKYLGDALSGKIEKNNILIGRNVNRIISYVPSPNDPVFIKNWVYACTIDIQTTLEMVLPIGKDIKQAKGLEYFSKNINLFDEQKVFQIFKLLCGFHLFIFLKNKDNNKFLDEVGLNKEIFEKKIFNIFEFSQNDKSLYLEFSKSFNDDVSNYALNLWDKAMKICFEKNYNTDAKILLILCTITMSNYNKIFYPTLIDIVKNNMGFFNKYNEIEKSLLEVYSKLFADMGLPDSHKMTEDILNQAIENSKKEGHYNLKNVGDILLEKEKSSGKVNQNFENKRKEGVKDEDIRWWFNLNDIERRMMVKVDEFHRLALFVKEGEEGKTDDEADAVVRKHHPIYGDLNDETHGDGDNRPLPHELKDRINIYIEKQGINNSEFKKQIDSSSTFNALVRKEIMAGNI